MDRSGSKFKIETSHAILTMEEKYVLQLRDDRPDVAAAGQWSLFGGGLNEGETPLEAMRRELKEELSIEPLSLDLLWKMDYEYEFVHGMVRTWFFHSDIESVWQGHKLREGQAVDLFSFDRLSAIDIPDVIRQAIKRYHLESHGKSE